MTGVVLNPGLLLFTEDTKVSLSLLHIYCMLVDTMACLDTVHELMFIMRKKKSHQTLSCGLPSTSVTNICRLN